MSEKQEEPWVYVAIPADGEDEEPVQRLLTEEIEGSAKDALTPKPEDRCQDAQDVMLWWLLVALAVASFFLTVLGSFFVAKIFAQTSFSSPERLQPVKEIPSRSIQLIPTFDAQAIEHAHYPVNIPWAERDNANNEYIPHVSPEMARQRKAALPDQLPERMVTHTVNTKTLSEVSSERQGAVRKRCDNEVVQNHDHCVEDETDTTKDDSSSSQGTKSAGGVLMSAQHGIDESEDAVIDSAEDRFEEFVSQRRILFVMFQAPWCAACRRLASPLETFAREVKYENLPIEVASVDCLLHADFCRSEFVEHFPTLRSYQRGFIQSSIELNEDKAMDEFYIQSNLLKANALMLKTKALRKAGMFEKSTATISGSMQQGDSSAEGKYGVVIE